MNKHGWLLLVALVAGQAQAADAPAPAPAIPPATDPAALAQARALPAPAADPGPGPGTETWRIGYTLGYSLGQRMSADLTDLDTNAFHEGFTEAFAHKPGKMTQAQMQQAFTTFQEKRAAQMQAMHDKMAADNLAKSNDFLAKNGKRKGVKTLPSGLQYEVVKKGKGASPAATDFVTAHYRGTLPDGTEFDSSLGGEPAEFPLDRVIAGWQEGVRLMNRGAKYKLYLPPALAYGDSGAGDGQVIGPNQALVFEVELIDFRPAPPASMDAAVPSAGEPASEPAAAPADAAPAAGKH